MDVSVTVGKANSAVTTAPTAMTLTYTGSAQALVNAGSATGGTMYYAVTTENNAPTDENLYTTSIPSKTDAGTYYVWYRVVGDANHSGYGPYCVAASILNAKVEPKEPTGNELVYNGVAQPLVKAGSVEGGTLLYARGDGTDTAPTEGWSEAVPTGTETGVYYVWYKVQGDNNHNDTEPVALEAKIARKSLVVTPAKKSKTYGEADP